MAGLVFGILFQYPAEYLHVLKSLEGRGEGSKPSVSCVDVVLSKETPLTVFRGWPSVLPSASVVQGSPLDLLSNYLTKSLPVYKRWLLQTSILHS